MVITLTFKIIVFQGPFVHIASIVATLLGKLSSFRGIYEVMCFYDE